MSNDGSKLRDALGRNLDGLQPETTIEQIRQRARRGRMLMATCVVVVVALIATTTAFTWVRLTDGSTERVVGPAPSPNDGLIAFVTQEKGDKTSWVAIVPAAGGEVTRLHEGRDPAWSPDGTRIAFGCDRGICTMNADGSDVIQLTDPAAPAFDEAPDWGPTGTIAFTRTYLDGKKGRDIFLISQDGGKEKTFEGQGPDDSSPTWSPDGTEIAFIRGVGAGLEAPRGGFQLFTANLDAPEVSRQLTTEGAARPDWSPDGRSILFDDEPSLWIVPAEGGGPRKLPLRPTDSSAVSTFASWAPDSRRFAFSCEAGICLSDIDSEGSTVLLKDGGSPAWQPNVQTDEQACARWQQEVEREAEARAARLELSPKEHEAERQRWLELLSDSEWFLDPDGSRVERPATCWDERGETDLETRWVTAVAEQAGFQVIPSDGGALEIYREPSTFRMWAFHAEQEADRRATLRAEGYQQVGMVGGIELFSDGERLTWEINGTYVWLSGVDGINAETLGVTDLVEAATVFAWDGGRADDADREDQLTQRVGQVACHDDPGDLLSEGSGDQSGRGGQPPDEDQPGTDLTGFSMARYSDRTLEISWGTQGRIPASLEPGARLSFVLTGTSKEPGYTFASITATLSNDRWKLLVRNEDDEAVTDQAPEVEGNVVNLGIEPDSVPRLMRGIFKWRAFSEWIPESTRNASEIYSDYCPDSGFPLFEGTSN